MHDLQVANRILKIILEYAKKNNLQKVTKAVIDLGVIEEHGQEILPANIKFNIKMLAKGTSAENLDLIIKQSKGKEWELIEIEGE